ncbi:MAG: M28 family peptidase [Muribaculaceae bacterium]|nr:M28 family peptidase [Muribaculaceae bacterium]
MRIIGIVILVVSILSGCGAHGSSQEKMPPAEDTGVSEKSLPGFEADSAYMYVKHQVEFGPRVPNTPAHEMTAEWLASELSRHGAVVTLQRADLQGPDGKVIHSTNIMGSYNADKEDRLLLMAHYDTRPIADKDPNPAKRQLPIDGANDGASGVGVLLEMARLLGAADTGKGIDILFVDAEDSGIEEDDATWALGARYFTENPIKPGYAPSQVILLDMVGGKGALFPAEYFSRRSAPALDDSFRAAAAREGYEQLFPNTLGGAVNDDHLPFLEQGIPAIDIIDYRPGRGFCPTWHTHEDNLSNIDKGSLEAVGKTLVRFIYE